MESTKYVGLDVHKEATTIAVMNSAGKLIMESIIETKASTILQCIQGVRGDLLSELPTILELSDGRDLRTADTTPHGTQDVRRIATGLAAEQMVTALREHARYPVPSTE